MVSKPRLREWGWLLALSALAAVSAAGEPTPEAPSPAVRVVPVTLATDAAFRRQANWRGLARWAIEQGTRDLEDAVGLRFKVMEERPWEASAPDLPLAEKLEEGLRQVAPGDGIAVFVTGAEAPRIPGSLDEIGYGLLGRPALILVGRLRPPPGEDTRTALAVAFRHELGHVFGLPHRPGPDVMAADETRRRWDYDDLGLEIFRATRTIDFAAAVPFAGCNLGLLGDVYHALAVEGGMEPSLLVNLGVAWRAARRPEEARRAFAAALRLAPDSRTAKLGLAQSLVSLGDTLAARAMAEGLGEAADLDPAMDGVLGGLWLDLGDLERADRYLTRAVAADSSSFGPRFRRGVLRMRTERYAQAREDFTAAARLEARPEAWFNLGLACDALGDRAAAIDAFTRCLDARPGEPLAGDARKWLERVQRPAGSDSAR